MSVEHKKFLVFIHHTIETTTRSGIQRVVVELCRSLLGRSDVDFVKWDETDGQLRYADRRDLANLFRDDTNINDLINFNCHRVDYRFGDTIENPENTWLIFPEIPYLMSNGNETFARLISQCKEYGVRVSAIFYDLIPFRDKDYSEGRSAHVEYMLELLRCDRIVGISQFVAADLLEFYTTEGKCSRSELDYLSRIICAVPLGEYREGDKWGKSGGISNKGHDNRKSIVMVGTIEPRKQQARFLRVFNDLRAVEASLMDYNIEIFGSLHPYSSDEFHTELKRNENIHYHQYSSDAAIDSAMSAAAFSVFPSKNEGFGLPIVESLRHGVPCLTASFGAMSEIASEGGCLVTDVLSDDAIAKAILKLVRDSKVLSDLRSEIVSRRLWSWGDYADELIGKLPAESENNVDRDIILKEMLETAQKDLGEKSASEFEFFGIKWSVFKASHEISHPTPQRQSADSSSSIFVIDVSLAVLKKATDATLTKIAEADVICFQSSFDEFDFAKLFFNRKIDRLLPACRVKCDKNRLADVQLISAINTESKARSVILERGRCEKLYSGMASRLRRELPSPKYKLGIIISTFNRALFTEMNLGWLVELTRGLDDQVFIAVVDNASTDDTMERLAKFQDAKNVEILTNSSNVGMLGNLHVTSTLGMARHLWTIGDDDFISRGAIERVLRVIETSPRVPIMAHNFAVYHRMKVSDGDTPDRYQGEQIRLSVEPEPSGMRLVRDLGQEHDNMFTAIYPLVFRSDIVAACFNYPFTGLPFGDLIESVPTTKIILESLALCDGYWFSEIGITGNAHNSWSSHRPRWHLVLMPKIFYLARQSRMDPKKIWDWLNVHLNLFHESIEIARGATKPIHITLSDIQTAKWMFQREVDVSSDLELSSKPLAPLWISKHHIQ
jgi:glycosyltransferase involved in cell wall biosynthesis